MNWIPRIVESINWAGWVLLIHLLLVAFFRYKDAYALLFQSASVLKFNPDFNQQRAEVLKPNKLFIILLSQMLWAFIFNQYLQWGFWAYLGLSLIFVVWFILKLNAIYFLGYLFEKEDRAFSVMTVHALNEITVYIPLLLFSFFIYYTDSRLLEWDLPYHIIGGVMYVVFRLRAGFQIFSRLNFRPYYIFLYLCALDAAPVLWVCYWF